MINTFQFEEGAQVYTPEGRGVIISRFYESEIGNNYLVRMVKIIDFLEPDIQDNVFGELDLMPIGECKECTPLTEDFMQQPEFKKYLRKQIAELRPYLEGEVIDSTISISQVDRDNGSPKVGDMIARNPKNHSDQWLVAEAYFKDNFEAKSGNDNV